MAKEKIVKSVVSGNPMKGTGVKKQKSKVSSSTELTQSDSYHYEIDNEYSIRQSALNTEKLLNPEAR